MVESFKCLKVNNQDQRWSSVILYLSKSRFLGMIHLHSVNEISSQISGLYSPLITPFPFELPFSISPLPPHIAINLGSRVVSERVLIGHAVLS